MKNGPTRNPDIPVAIYVLEDATQPGAVRYVGQTASLSQRLHNHLGVAACGRQGELYDWLRTECRVPRLRVLGIVAPEESNRKETEAIAFFRRLGFPLLNATDGGSGVRGCARSAEANARHSELMKKITKLPEWVRQNGPSNKGRPMSEEQKKALSLAQTGVPNSKEQNQAISKALKGRPKSGAFCANLSLVQRGKPKSPEHVEGIKQGWKIRRVFQFSKSFYAQAV